MKTILILAVLSLVGCRTRLPELPKLKAHYLIEVRNETPDLQADAQFMKVVVNIDDINPMGTSQVVRCLKFNIVSMYPYRIRFVGEKPLIECDMVGGYKPSDLTKILNWIDDVVAKFK